MPYQKTQELLITANTNVALALYRIQPGSDYPYSALGSIRTAMDALHQAESALIDEAAEAEEVEAGNA